MNTKITKNYQNVSNSALIDTEQEGPTVWISAGIHGNEKSGVEALEEFYKMIESGVIKIKKGKLFFLFKGNEQALEKNAREVKHNLNRCINNYQEQYNEEDYEIQRGKQIKELIDILKPSYGLDLHSVSAPNALPYLFSGLQAYKFAKNLGIQNIAVNWANTSNTKDKPNNEYKISDKNQGIADYINYTGGFGYTFEAGSHNSPNGKENSMQAIINFLLALDMIKGEGIEFKNIISDKKDTEQKHVHMEYRHTFKGGFEYKDNKIPASFSFYKKGEIIGYDIINGEKQAVEALFDGYIVLPKDPKICKTGKEVFFFGKSMEEIKQANN